MAKINNLFSRETKAVIKSYLLVIAGSILLAIGTGVFLLPAVLNTGGLMGLGLIGEKLFGIDPDIAVLILTWTFFIISLLFLGWRFTLKSLVSSICYPIMLILLMRIPSISTEIVNLFGPTADTATKLIAGVFGGVFCGTGVAITFIGGGSTGGVDIIVVILNKFTRVSHSILSFIVDGTIILVGLFVLQDVILALVGIMSAFVYAITLEFVFGGRSHSLTAQIISPTKSKEINEYIQNNTNRGSTLIPVKGGYQGSDYTMISVTFDRSEYAKIINGVARIDKDAFVTIKQTATVLGEGFNSLVPKKEGLVNINKRDE